MSESQAVSRQSWQSAPEKALNSTNPYKAILSARTASTANISLRWIEPDLLALHLQPPLQEFHHFCETSTIVTNFQQWLRPWELGAEDLTKCSLCLWCGPPWVLHAKHELCYTSTIPQGLCAIHPGLFALEKWIILNHLKIIYQNHPNIWNQVDHHRAC